MIDPFFTSRLAKKDRGFITPASALGEELSLDCDSTFLCWTKHSKPIFRHLAPPAEDASRVPDEVFSGGSKRDAFEKMDRLVIPGFQPFDLQPPICEDLRV